MKTKKFYYTGKNYYNATFTETYTREGRWKKILYTIAEESRPYIRHDGKRIYFDDIMRTDGSGLPTEIKAEDGETVNICGYQANVYYKPLFVELDDGGEAARVYRYEGSETDYT